MESFSLKPFRDKQNYNSIYGKASALKSRNNNMRNSASSTLLRRQQIENIIQMKINGNEAARMFMIFKNHCELKSHAGRINCFPVIWTETNFYVSTNSHKMISTALPLAILHRFWYAVAARSRNGWVPHIMNSAIACSGFCVRTTTIKIFSLSSGLHENERTHIPMD